MSWLICGTIPEAGFPLVEGAWQYDPETAELSSVDMGLCVSAQRGTPALMASSLQAVRALDCEPPLALLVGDIGDGHGSDSLYRHLAENVSGAGACPYSGITFHYLFPDLDGHNRVLAALEGLEPRPILVADAGFMYVAKMSGYASTYDLFTPDVGELAFLADEKAPHPLYTRGFLGAGEAGVPALVRRACAHGNAAKVMLVKGSTDVVARDGVCVARVAEPQTPALEAIGGTGDIVAGLVTALLAAGLPLEQACLTACRAGRRAGQLACPTPATQVAEILPYIPQALREALDE